MAIIETLANQATLVTKCDMNTLHVIQGKLKGLITLKSLTPANHGDGRMVKVSSFQGTRDGVFSILAGCFHTDSNFWQTVSEMFREELNGQQINFNHCIIQSDFNDAKFFVKDTDMVKILESYYINLLADTI